MGVTNNLKAQVDLPVWEWCRFAPAATTAVSSLTTGNSLENRYLYYQISNFLYRYDTYQDSWQVLSSTPANTPTIMNSNVLSNAAGHNGQAIGSGGGLNTIELAGLSGRSIVGYKIRICGGTGSGQERTIISVSDAIQHERGICTTASSTQVIDASSGVGLKLWKPNMWKNYQVRIDWGTGRTQLRPILYNTQNTLTFTDVNHITIDPWSNCPLTLATAANNSFFTIESHIATVDANWDVVPDETSKFIILSGGIWNISQGTTAAPFFSLMYYDVLSDVWYQKTTETGLKARVFLAGSDLKLERFTEAGGAIISTTDVVSSTARSITTATVMAPMSYANFEIRIVAGTGIGQTRTITSNTSSIINITRDWSIIPDNTSKYEIWRDAGKLFLVGGNDAGMLMYSAMRDQWSTGKQYDDGQANNLAAIKSGQDPIALTSIARTATSMILPGAIEVAGSGYNINDLLTVDAKGGVVRVTSINSTGGVTGISLESCGTGYTSGIKTTVASPAGGTGCTINLASGDIDFTELATTVIAHNFKIGDTVTMVGATGTGASKFNGSYVIKGISTLTTNLTFSYCSVGDPGAATATIPFSQSSTTLVDCTKNWTIDEHKGKLIQLSTNAVLSVGQVRRIVSNTATTITWTLAATAPTNGTSRYLIQDIKPFGTDRMSKGEISGTEGFATSGSTTTLVDTTKNWETNYWSRTVNRKVRIVEGTGVGNEMPITSNTSNTLTFATQTFSPDTTTRYIIMDAFGTATGGSATTLVDAGQNWETNYWVGSRVRLLAGTGHGNEYSIIANTSTTLTYASGVTADTSTAYAILEATPKAYGLNLDCITGCSVQSINHRYLYSFTGTATPELSRYNINTEHWEFLSYFPQNETMTTGSMFCYDGEDRIYVNLSTVLTGASGRLMYYDIAKNITVPYGQVPYGHSTVIPSNRMEIIKTADGLKYLYIMRHSGQEMWRTLISN